MLFFLLSKKDNFLHVATLRNINPTLTPTHCIHRIKLLNFNSEDKHNGGAPTVLILLVTLYNENQGYSSLGQEM